MNPWFGEPWPSAATPAPVCEDPARQVPTPVGAACLWCGVPIADGDQGTLSACVRADGSAEVLPAHKECTLRNIMGCSASLRGEPHDHERDYRQDALAVQAWFDSPAGRRAF